MQCAECQDSYNPKSPRDRRRHLDFHEKYLNGLLFGLIDENHVVWRGDKPTLAMAMTDDLPNPCVALVTPRSPLALRKLATEVARLANLETQYTGGIYDHTEPPDPERDRHLFLYRLYGRIAGLAVFDRRTSEDVATWQEYDEGTESNWTDTTPFWSISYIWTLRKYRRKGIATRLIDVAAHYLGTTVARLGVSAPLTEKGEAFARSRWLDLVRFGA